MTCYENDENNVHFNNGYSIGCNSALRAYSQNPPILFLASLITMPSCFMSKVSEDGF